MTTVAILQPGFMPWLGFFNLLKRCDVFVYYDDVQFDKHGWRNRNKIKTSSGEMWVTVPVIHSNKHGQKILDVQIDNSRDWGRKISRAIYQSYAKASYTQQIYPEIEAILLKNWDSLLELDCEIVNLILSWLSLKRSIHFSSKLNIHGDKTSRLVNICAHFKATTYISGNAAQAYLQLNEFTNNGINVEWQNFIPQNYSQLHGEFIPYLSAIDCLMNEGPARAMSNI